jgi:hypothetical protein
MLTLVNNVYYVKNFFGSLEGIRSFAPGPRDGELAARGTPIR